MELNEEWTAERLGNTAPGLVTMQMQPQTLAGRPANTPRKGRPARANPLRIDTGAWGVVTLTSGSALRRVPGDRLQVPPGKQASRQSGHLHGELQPAPDR